MKRSIKVLIAGALLLVGGFVFGLAGTIMGMIRTFSRIAESGTGSPKQLAEGIDNSLISTAVGIPVSFIGLCLVIGGLIAYFVGKQQSKSEPDQSGPV
jgi:uncharacterized membrane protein